MLSMEFTADTEDRQSLKNPDFRREAEPGQN
uniref:Uncharacterized protein n=1 Tax=Nelumbo nucifera TaxID=4432 RepID=A0A822ZMU4_NELNU|nr:TPA_asm: hypothetical protein HUJ06_016479 [Nelumbo nucifera]